MDNFYHFTSEHKRCFSITPQVQGIGYMPQKRSKIHNTFESMNFSFILSGSGYYKTSTQSYKVIAPCVIIQEPGEFYDYGPQSEWEELYLIFKESDRAYFLEKNLLNPKRPIWYFQHNERLEYLMQFCSLQLERLNEFGLADQLDLLSIESVMESLINRNQLVRTEEEVIIDRIKKNIEQDFKKLTDVQHLINSENIKEFLFRKLWNKRVGDPPHRYLTKLKMQYAARQLVETNKNISEISYELCIEDPLYFSRMFSKQYLCCPRKYRQGKLAMRSMLS